METSEILFLVYSKVYLMTNTFQNLDNSSVYINSSIQGAIQLLAFIIAGSIVHKTGTKYLVGKLYSIKLQYVNIEPVHIVINNCLFESFTDWRVLGSLQLFSAFSLTCIHFQFEVCFFHGFLVFNILLRHIELHYSVP